MFRLIPLRAWIGLGVGLTLLAGVWYYGATRYADGRKDLLTEIEQARAASVEEKERIEDEIADLDDAELLRRALEYVSAGSGR